MLTEDRFIYCFMYCRFEQIGVHCFSSYKFVYIWHLVKSFGKQYGFYFILNPAQEGIRLVTVQYTDTTVYINHSSIDFYCIEGV